MPEELLHYDRMVENALRGVLRQALEITARHGLHGQHHFYITFRTGAPGAIVPDRVRARYPDEMTIVLQHQFWGLEVAQDWFEVTLSFNRVNERLRIPFAAVTAFADPSAQFGLQFQVEAAPGGVRPAEVEPPPAPPAPGAAAEEPTAAESSGQVIALDAFRKK